MTDTVRSVVARFLEHAVATHRYCREAFGERKRTLDGFVAHLGDRFVSDCCADDLGAWIEANPRWKATNTRRAKCQFVQTCFNWAAKRGRIARNPFAGLTYEEGDPRPATPDPLFEQVMERAALHVRRMLQFMRLTGVRPCELRQILWEEVDWQRAVIVHHKHKTRKKTRKPRTIVLTPEAESLLKVIRMEAKDQTGPIFRNADGNPWKKQSLVQHWQRLRKRAKVEKAPNTTMHGVRHQNGTTAVKNGANIKLISLALGHASVTTTERYYVQVDQEFDAIRREMQKSR